MKKETIIAVVFGIMLGGFFGLTLINKNKETQLVKNKVIAPTNITDKPLTTTSTSPIQNLEISSPEDGIVVDNANVKITGKTEANSLIIIQTPIKDISFKTEKIDSSFDLSLALGENVIKIVAYSSDKNQNPQEKDLKIYYLDSQL